MSNIRLFTSNQMEILADQLAEVAAKPLSSPFKPEAIVVQSSGMERWISMQLAERLGIWSNCRYYYPNQIIEEIFKYLIPEAGNQRIFDKELNAWRIMRLLPECVKQKEDHNLLDYISDDEGFLKTYQLSSLIADTFDQYLTFRPEMILEWEKSNKGGWQGELWRLLMNETGLVHPPKLKEIFFERIANPEGITSASLPERISVFGISSMPVYHLDILSAVSDYIEVCIFFMNPSAEYWADIHTEKKIAGALGTQADKSAEELHLEKGNSLLASMGKSGSDFLHNLMKYDFSDFQKFEGRGRNFLLACLQYDILSMIDRGAPGEEKAHEFSPIQMQKDNSIKIHSCHSRLREVEILHDNILDMLNGSGIEPRDICVMTPDIESYSPYINAIFDQRAEDIRIPYSIADLSRRNGGFINAFFAALDMADSRFESAKVIDLLERAEVMEKFGLTPAEIRKLRQWIKDVNINWGIDAKYRAGFGLPAFSENTWLSGIDRLLLGYAMPDNGMIYNDILPYDIEGSESQTLGKFIEFFNTLKDFVNSISVPRILSEWSDILKNFAGRLLEPDESGNMVLLTEAFIKLETIGKESGFSGKTSLSVIKEFIDGFLKEKYYGGGFLTGGITFCAMLPMRSIPFKAVCLIGMNDAEFPRPDKAVSLDLISSGPRRGDRSRRLDDRYIFLESIISARERLYISYIGQSIKDNSTIPPSVLVSELMDYIEQGYFIKDNDIKKIICIEHPLHEFSPRYFVNDPDLFSYSREKYAAGKASLQERKNPELFIKGELSEQYDYGKIINIDDLIKFYTYPAKHLLRTRLGIYLEEEDEILKDNEPFDISGLNKYNIGDELCRHIIEGGNADDLYNKFRASGLLPHGGPGKSEFTKMIPAAQNFASIVRNFTKSGKPCKVELKLDVSGHTIAGILENVFPDMMLSFRYADTKAKDRLKAWICHVFLNASIPKKSMLICKDAVWEMEPVKGAEILEELIDIFLKGMNGLIPFFPDTSLEYSETYFKKGHIQALKQAGKEWAGSDYISGEGNDPYNYLCYKSTNPLNRDFADISLKIFGPILEFQKKMDI